MTLAPKATEGGGIVVESPYGRVSVLICSELLEARRLADLVGRVEVVVVPSWNRDTASYDHLVQTAGMHLNSFVAIANNGHYSDCRVWAPMKSRWKRDLCRLIERDVDGTIAVILPLASLRAWRRQTDDSASAGETDWRPLPPDWE